MDEMVLKLDGTPICAPQLGDLMLYYFNFKKVPKFKIGTVHEPGATYRFTVRLKVSRTLLFTQRWPELNEMDRTRCLFQFVQDRLKERGLSSSELGMDLELNSYVAGASRLPERYDIAKIQMNEWFPVPLPRMDESKPPIGFGR